MSPSGSESLSSRRALSSVLPRFVSTVAISAVAMAVVASVAPAQPSPGDVPVEIFDPSGRALSAFHAALGRGERTRVMVWGASHTSEDRFTGYLRASLQARYGDGGPGLVFPARPFPLYDHQGVEIAETGAWRAVRVRGRQRTPGRYGPAGFAIEASRRAAAFVSPDRPVDDARVFYLEQPAGGHFSVRADRGEARSISTRGDRVRSVTLSGGVRRLELRTRGDGPVRLFGVSLERDQPGVIVDAMGSPGARLRDRLPWDDRAMGRQLRALSPDLIVLAYGTNESGFRGRPIRRYRADVDEALRRARAMNPEASCLIIGPSDWPERTETGGFVARPRTARVIAVQREMARRHGCGHFDLVAFQGGPVSMPRWVAAGLALPDHIHFTDRGHRRLAIALERALLRGAPRPPGPE